MTALDQFLRDQRVALARRYVRPGDRLLDAACDDRTLLERSAFASKRAAGIAREAQPFRQGKIDVRRGSLPADHPFAPGEFDTIVLLHALPEQRDALARECLRLLSPGGRVILVLPDALAPRLHPLLRALHLSEATPPLPAPPDLLDHRGPFQLAGLRLLHHGRSRLALARLFVFEKARGWPSTIEVKPVLAATTLRAIR